MAKDFLNLSELSKASGYSRQTIYNDMEKGIIIPAKSTEHEQLFDKKDVEKYLIKKGRAPLGRRVISFVNHKGGVGKTMVLVHVAYFLAENGNKVLIMDNDSQGNASNWFLAGKERTNRMTQVYKKEMVEDYMIDNTNHKNIDIISADITLNEIEYEVRNKRFPDNVLERAFKDSGTLLDKYNFILIDNSPSLGIFPFNSMVVSDGIVIPVEARAMSIPSQSDKSSGVEAIIQNLGYTKAHMVGIVLNFYRKNTTESKSVRDYYKNRYGDKVFNTVLPLTVQLSIGSVDPETLEYTPNPPAYTSGRKEVKDMIDKLGKEFLERLIHS